MKKTAAAYTGKRWLRKGFLITLTVLMAGGTFSTIGTGKAWAIPVDKVVQTVAGTGTEGSSKAPKAIWSELNRPTDIELIEFSIDSEADKLHGLLLNDPGNGESWFAFANGLGFGNQVDSRLQGDYVPFRFLTEDGATVIAKDFAYPKVSESLLDFEQIYFTGYAGNSDGPNVFRFKKVLDDSQNASNPVISVEVEAVLNPNLLNSAAGLAFDDEGYLYTYDDAVNQGYRFLPSQDAVLPYATEDVGYMSGFNFGQPHVFQDFVIEGRFMYTLSNPPSDPTMITKIEMSDGEAVPIQVGGLNQPTSLAVSSDKDVYVADTGNNRVVQFYDTNASYPELITVAGGEDAIDPSEGRPADETALSAPQGVTIAEDGTVYISDTGHHRVIQIAPPQSPASEVNGQAGNAKVDLFWTPADDALYYEIYKYAGSVPPAEPDSRAWELAGSTLYGDSPSSNAFTVTGLTNGQPYVFAVKAKGLRSTSVFAVSPKLTPVGPPTTTPTNPTNPTNPPIPSAGGGTSTPVATPPAPAPTNTTTINVNVQSSAAANGSVVASLAITRTTGADGTVKDALQLTPAKATEIIELLKPSGSKTAAIVLPDANDAVSQWDFTVPAAASKLLTDQGIELVVLNPNVRIQVPASSLTGLTDDLYFRLIPVKSTATSSEIQSRALANPEIMAAANGGDINVVGRPMTIETNLQSRPVTLSLPLPEGSNFTAQQQKKLGVYIEHSDGTKQLMRGKVVTLDSGRQGLEISVNKFSTFTIVNVSNWGSTLNAKPYILGYKDGSFKPAQNITRAELAAIVGRITGVTEGTSAFSDVKNGSWASTVVGPAAASGIMTGYGDGTFKPNASITRGELAAVLAKLLPQSGLEANIQAAGFSDLAASHWAAAPAAELQAAGVVTGYADGSFKPEQNVTRAEAVTMINRLIGLDGSMALPGAASWNDVADTYWAYDAVRAASMQK